MPVNEWLSEPVYAIRVIFGVLRFFRVCGGDDVRARRNGKATLCLIVFWINYRLCIYIFRYWWSLWGTHIGHRPNAILIFREYNRIKGRDRKNKYGLTANQQTAKGANLSVGETSQLGPGYRLQFFTSIRWHFGCHVRSAKRCVASKFVVGSPSDYFVRMIYVLDVVVGWGGRVRELLALPNSAKLNSSGLIDVRWVANMLAERTRIVCLAVLVLSFSKCVRLAEGSSNIDYLVAMVVY